MKTAIARAKVGVDLWIAISVLSAASSCPVDAAGDLVVSVVASCEAMLKEYCPGLIWFSGRACEIGRWTFTYAKSFILRPTKLSRDTEE